MAEILNPRIDQLPDGNPGPNDYFVFRDMITNVTRRVKADQIIAAPTTQNFEWVSDKDPAYQDDEVVTYGGKWYQSTTDNNTSVPGENSDWEELNKAPSGLVFWQAGVFVEDEVFVLSYLGETVELFRLNTETTRPFVSEDFTDELLSGHWIQVTNNIEVVEIETTGGTLTIDCEYKAKINFTGSEAIAAAKTWVIDNYDFLKESRFDFTITNAESDIQTMPPGVKMIQDSGVFNPATGEWTPYSAGDYEAIIRYDGANLKIRIEGPYSDPVSS
jgi:hypothetical protein